MKFLINLASLVLCLGILAFGGYQTVSAMQIDDMMSEIQAALDSALDLPDLPKKGFGVEVPAGSTAVLDENTTLKAEDITDTIAPTVQENVSAAVGEGKESSVLVAYDVSLVRDGVSVQPGGKVKVTLPAPDNADDYDSLKVAYIADDGSVTLYNTTVNADRTVSFLTDHFSCYAVIGVNEAKADENEPEHTHRFIAGKCECGESDPNYVPPHFHEFIKGVCECGESDPNYVPPHEHKYVEGKCECGETNPNYNPHKHSYINGKCECGESDPNYVPPHEHKYVEGKCSCGVTNPNYKPPHKHSYIDGRCSCGSFDPNHVHEYVEGKCKCGHSDPDYKPGLSTEAAKDSFANMYDTYDPDSKELGKEFFMGVINGALGNTSEPEEPEHTHRFIAGECACGEEDPNYVPPHIHEFVKGVCKCGESDPNYVPPHEHKYVEGKCSCGETNPNYNPHKHSYINGKCECGESDPNYVPPHVHAFVKGKCSCGEINPNYVPPHEHSYVDGWCSCGDFDPNHVHEYVEGECKCGELDPDYEQPDENNVNDLIVDVAGTYFDKLQEGIQQNQEQNADASEEEKEAAKEEFVQKESEAFAGLLNIATKPEETTDDQLIQSVDAVIKSDVCLGTVTESVQSNGDLTTTVQDATAGMNEETKAQIENKITEAYDSTDDQAKKDQYKDLANLFGITIGEGGVPSIPGDLEIPGGVIPGIGG